jgi:hypothetical protein
MKLAKYFTTVLCGGLGLFLLGMGITNILTQQRQIETFKPVQAIISSSKPVKQFYPSKGQKKEKYIPRIRYSYEVNGRTYSNDSAFPSKETGSRGWAKKVTDRYKKGDESTAYYNPANPAESFLIREYSFEPYIAVFPGIFLTVLGFIFYFAPVISNINPPPPRQVEPGRFKLVPSVALGRKQRIALSGFIVWTGAWGLTAFHYFSHASQPEIAAYIVSAIYLAASIGILAGFLHFKRLGKHVGQAMVFTGSGTFRLGNNIKAEIRQKVKSGVQIEKARFGLLAYKLELVRIAGKPTVNNEIIYEKWFNGLRNYSLPQQETLSFDADFEIPTDIPATSPVNTKSYPRYYWVLSYKLELENNPDYRERYFIRVEA